MIKKNLLAVDIALLLPEPVNQRARALNQALGAHRADGFFFDSSHLPHLTLVQMFVERASLPALIERMDPILTGTPPLALRVTGVASSTSAAQFVVGPTPELQRLHETLMDAVQPLEETGGDSQAFYCMEGPSQEPPRDGDIRWVSQFRARSGYARFEPHITLGIGPPPEFGEPFEFTAERVALCHLCRFCTCRVVLKEWRLGAGDG